MIEEPLTASLSSPPLSPLPTGAGVGFSTAAGVGGGVEMGGFVVVGGVGFWPDAGQQVPSNDLASSQVVAFGANAAL